MALPSFLRIPKPKTVLGFIPLRSAVEFIFLVLCFNRLTGLYGLLALVTGFSLNPLQLSQYIHSLATLVTTLYLFPSLRRADQPLRVLGLAWLFIIDSAVNAAYTALFGISWFIVLAQHLNDEARPGDTPVPGAGTINDTAGFTDPEFNASTVEVVATPAAGALPGQDAVAIGVGSGAPGTLGGAVFQSGSLASITVISALWLIRLYFCLLVLSYARSVIRSYVLTTSNTYTHSSDPTLAENPFREGRDEGQGWRGKVGRTMLRFPTQWYWLGRDENEDEWVRATSGRFARGTENGGGRQALRIRVPEAGVGERERRARSGTGPPPPLVPGKKLEKMPS